MILPTQRIPRRILAVTMMAAALLAEQACRGESAIARVEGPRISVAPQQRGEAGYRNVSFFDFEGGPGSTMSGRFVITNTGSEETRVALDPVDATTAQNLGFAYETRGSEPHGSTKWIDLSRTTVRVAPGRSQAVGLEVDVPAGAPPGDELSGVSVQALGQAAEQRGGGAVITQTRRFAIGVFVKVPGRRDARAELTGARVEVRPSGLAFTVAAHNTGNVLLRKVTGSIDVTTQAGAKVASRSIGPGTFVAHTNVDIPVVASGFRAKEGEKFRVSARFDYDGKAASLERTLMFGAEQAQRQDSVTGERTGSRGGKGSGLPVWVFGAIGAGVLGLVLAGLVVAMRRRRRRGGRGGRPLDQAAGMALLEREVARNAESGSTLSVLAAWIPEVDGGRRASAARHLAGVMRKGDSLVDLGGGWLMVVAPNTGAAFASGMADDLRRSLQALGGGPGGAVRVGCATVEESASAQEIIHDAALAAG